MNIFPATLKRWRQIRRLSQMDLAGKAGVSARHISFLETGRAKPSREMIARLSDSLQLPMVAQNQILTHAGFAIQYPSRQWDAPDMAPIRSALSYTLERHNPYPAIALDRLWVIEQMNETAQSLFKPLDLTKGSSLLEWILTDNPSQFIENWPDVAYHTVQRLRTESSSQGGSPDLDRAADQLAEVACTRPVTLAPVVPTQFKYGHLRLSLFSTIAQFGTPEDLVLDDLRIELFFPSDNETQKILNALSTDGV